MKRPPTATAGTAERDQTRKLDFPLSTTKSLSLFEVLRGWYWRSALRVLLAEIHNLTRRISWALEVHAWERRGCTGQIPVLLAEKLERQCQRCRCAYISDTQQILNQQPSLTVVDAHLVTQAWRAGWRSALRTDTPKNQNTLCSLCAPMDAQSYAAPNSSAIDQT
jgi:hypothetical protein